MTQFNLTSTLPLDQIYHQGWLPQRNQSGLFYASTSGRSNLANFSLSSENRRILKNTNHLNFSVISLSKFSYTPQIQKQCFDWVKKLGWDFPVSSIKTVFTHHLFNTLYLWQDGQTTVGYGLVLVQNYFSHIAYVFYDPAYGRLNLPIRMVLQVIIDSQAQNKHYCYLGQFSPTQGFYKRNMPGFEYFANGQWITYNKNSLT